MTFISHSPTKNLQPYFPPRFSKQNISPGRDHPTPMRGLLADYVPHALCLPASHALATRCMGAATGTILLRGMWVGHACTPSWWWAGSVHAALIGAQAAHLQILRASSHFPQIYINLYVNEARTRSPGVEFSLLQNLNLGAAQAQPTFSAVKPRH